MDLFWNTNSCNKIIYINGNLENELTLRRLCLNRKYPGAESEANEDEARVSR